MNKTFLEAIRIIFTIIAIVLAIISIILILIKLFGHSPDEDTIIFSIIGILVVLQVAIISVLFQIKEDVGSFKEFKREVINFKDQTISKIENIDDRLLNIKDKISKKK